MRPPASTWRRWKTVTDFRCPDPCPTCLATYNCYECPGHKACPGTYDTPNGLERLRTGFSGTFAGLFDEAFGVLLDRQRKYGPGNITQQGIYGVVTRIADDKAQRLKRALNGTIVNGRVDIEVADGEDGDTFEDACIDLANYALIALALKRGLWGQELTDEETGRLVLQ